MTEKQPDGHKALSEMDERVTGKIHIDSITMPDPVVQPGSYMAVLTYNIVSYSNGKGYQWN